jgi:hypothetical protein
VIQAVLTQRELVVVLKRASGSKICRTPEIVSCRATELSIDRESYKWHTSGVLV